MRDSNCCNYSDSLLLLALYYIRINILNINLSICRSRSLFCSSAKLSQDLGTLQRYMGNK